MYTIKKLSVLLKIFLETVFKVFFSWSERNRIELKLLIMVIKGCNLMRRSKLEKDENILPFRSHQAALPGEMSGTDTRNEFKSAVKEEI